MSKRDTTSRRPTSGVELIVSGVLAAWLGRLIGKKVLGEEWVRRAERIDSRADELAEEAEGQSPEDKRDVLPGFDEMLESRHQRLHSLSVPPQEDGSN